MELKAHGSGRLAASLICLPIVVLTACGDRSTNGERSRTSYLLPPQSRAVTTHHNDNGRTGMYPSETVLTPDAVMRQGMRLKRYIQLGEAIRGQPLYVPAVTGVIGAQGPVDMVFAVSGANKIYAFDANSADTSPTSLWVTQLSESDPNTPRKTARGNIMTTPVVDMTTSTLYMVFLTGSGDSPNIGATPDSDAAAWIVALDIHDGSIKKQAMIGGSYTGLNRSASFDARVQLNRPALLLNNGNIYIAFGVRYEALMNEYHGWVFGYDATSLAQIGVFCTSTDWPGRRSLNDPNDLAEGAGIWQGGGGLVGDAAGNVYLFTGNGWNSASAGSPPQYYGNGDSAIKLSPTLRLGDWFTPFDEHTLDINDTDLGSGGPLLIPGTSYLVGGGKTGILYLLDTNSMRTPLQSFHVADTYDFGNIDPKHHNPLARSIGTDIYGGSDGNQIPHLHSTPAFWHSPTLPYGILYTWAENDMLKASKLYDATHRFTTQPGCGGNTAFTTEGTMGGNTDCATADHTSPVVGGSYYWSHKTCAVCAPKATPNDPSGLCCHATKVMPGGMLSLSSNQNQLGTAIVWATLPAPNYFDATDWLYAFKAEDLSLLWQTNFPITAKGQEKLARFAPPTIADGKVILAMQDGLRIYELNSSGTYAAKDGYGAMDACPLVSLNGAATCAVAIHRLWNSTNGFALSNAPVTGANGLYHQQWRNAYDDFFLLQYPDSTYGNQPLYACVNSGLFLATLDPNCEAWGLGAQHGILGYLSSAQQPGMVALTRLVKHDHLYTIDPNEVQTAQSQYGYKFEKVVGYVWPQARIGIHRSEGWGEHLYTGDPIEASTGRYVPDALDYFYLFAKPDRSDPSLVPFFQCVTTTLPVAAQRWDGEPLHFYTTDPNCETWGATALDYPIGYIATTAHTGTTALLRMKKINSSFDHPFVLTQSEVDGDVMTGYFVQETSPGYVWTAPAP